MFFNKRTGEVRFLFVVLFILVFSVGVYGSLFVDNSYESCGGDNLVVILTSHDGARGFGHTALLIEDINGSWFYFSWQSSKVVFVEVPSFALNNFNNFNSWVMENNSVQEYVFGFDSFIVVSGNFSKSLVDAELKFVEYLNFLGVNFNNFNISSSKNNPVYDIFFNNCLYTAYSILSDGIIGDFYFSDVVVNPSFVPVIAEKQFESLLCSEKNFWVNS